jgi:hypothetical protein
MIGVLRFIVHLAVIVAASIAWLELYTHVAYAFFYSPGKVGARALDYFGWGLVLSLIVVCVLVTWLFGKLWRAPIAKQTSISFVRGRVAIALVFFWVWISVLVGQRLVRGTAWGDTQHFAWAMGIEISVGALIGFTLYWRLTRARTNEPPQTWFSTESQFEAFNGALAAGNAWRRFFGRYPIPQGAAYGSALPWMKTPLVLVARGELAITETAIVFSPLNRNSWSARRYHNVAKEFGFEIALSDITSIAPQDSSTIPSSTDGLLSNLVSNYWLPWTKITTSKAEPLNEFFLAVGGRNRDAMPTYREMSLALRKRLLEAIAGRRVGGDGKSV